MQCYLEASQEGGHALFSRKIEGEVIMLNLLRFRERADYSAFPDLDPGRPVSGADAYRSYIDHTLPLLLKSGGDILFLGDGGRFLIGPFEERWDLVMMVRQNSLQDFMAFSDDAEYLAGIGHRHAALEDSRLLPLTGGCLDK